MKKFLRKLHLALRMISDFPACMTDIKDGMVLIDECDIGGQTYYSYSEDWTQDYCNKLNLAKLIYVLDGDFESEIEDRDNDEEEFEEFYQGL